MTQRPHPTFLGYSLKAVLPRPDGLSDRRVVEICSVSDCMSKAPCPESKWQRWAFNASGFYSTPELAAADGEAGQRASEFGYELFPLRFEDGRVAPMEVGLMLATEASLLPAGPEPGFEFIGHDAVSVRFATPGGPGTSPIMAGFDCSPLSCNNLAPHYSVGHNCLIDDWHEAARAATDFSRDQPEPGPYVLFGVFRRIGDPPRPKPHTS